MAQAQIEHSRRSPTCSVCTDATRDAPHQPGELWLGELVRSSTGRPEAKEHMLDAAALDAWLDSLKPPPGTWPSLGNWPRAEPPWSQDVQWLDLGKAMIYVEGLPMCREMGAYSTCLTYGKKLGAPHGRDARVDIAWDRMDPKILLGRALENVVELDMADATTAERKRVREELTELFDPNERLGKLRRFAHEFWHEPAPEHPRDTPYCWAWCAAPMPPAGA